jgi:hypothetical protein
MCGRWNDNNADPKLHLTVEFYFGQTKLGRWHVYPFGMQFKGRLAFVDLSRLGAGTSIIAMAMGSSELDHNWRTQPALQIFDPFEGFNNPALGRNHVFRSRAERNQHYHDGAQPRPQGNRPHAAHNRAQEAPQRDHVPQHRLRGASSASLATQEDQDAERVHNRIRLRAAIEDANAVADLDPEEALSVISKHTSSIAERSDMVRRHSNTVSYYDAASQRDTESRYSQSAYGHDGFGSEYGTIASVYVAEPGQHDAMSRSSQSVSGHDNLNSEYGSAAIAHRAVESQRADESRSSRSRYSDHNSKSEYGGAASNNGSGPSQRDAGSLSSQSVYGHDNPCSGYGVVASDYGPGSSQYSIAATKASSFITDISPCRVMPGYAHFKSAKRPNNHVRNWLQRIPEEDEEAHICKTHVDEPPVSAAYLAHVALNEIWYESDTMTCSHSDSGDNHRSEHVSKDGNMEEHQEYSQVVENDYDYELGTASIHP